MKELLSEIQTSEFLEYQRASVKFGVANNSPHESYAVILEEFDEAMKEGDNFSAVLKWLWCEIKSNKPKEQLNARFEDLQHFAEHAAAEWVQVAAMCYKARQIKEGKG